MTATMPIAGQADVGTVAYLQRERDGASYPTRQPRLPRPALSRIQERFKYAKTMSISTTRRTQSDPRCGDCASVFHDSRFRKSHHGWC
jgi:hypothetical protein